jgi:hydrogenase maturation protease
LLDLWDGAEIAVVVDSVRTGAPAGTVHRIALDGTAPATSGGSTHGLGLGAAVELACALDRLPPTLVVYGIEAGDAGDGLGLRAAVAEAADQVAADIVRMLDGEVRRCV